MELTLRSATTVKGKALPRKMYLLPILALVLGAVLAAVVVMHHHRQLVLPPPGAPLFSRTDTGGIPTCLDPTPGNAIEVRGAESPPPVLERLALLASRRCAFGRWFHSEPRRRVAQAYPELQPRFALLEQLHQELHRAALVVETYLARGDRPSAVRHHRQNTLPILEQLIQTLAACKGDIDRVCLSGEKDLAACSRKFEVLYLNFGGVLCGLQHFDERVRDQLPVQASRPSAPLNATPLSAR